MAARTPVVLGTDGLAQQLQSGDTISAAIGYAQSLGPSGYQKLPSGFTLQWGQVTPATGGTATVTFPTPFATACVLAIGTAFQTQTSGQLATVSTQSMSTTGCSLAARTQAGITGGNGSFPVLWFAIGY